MTKAERTLLVAIARAIAPIVSLPDSVELLGALTAVARQTGREQRQADELKRAAAWQDQL
jgi:hypothetical protein